MQRAHVCAALGTVLMLAASSTYAGQVELSVENRIGGDSNVFRAEDDLTDDGTYDIAPRLAVHDDDEDVTYEFDYQPTYRKYFKTSGINGVDHIAHARTAWLPGPQDKFEASGSYYNGRQFLFGSSGSGAGSTLTVNDRERIRISDANLGYRRALSPRLSFRVDGMFDDFDASGTSPQSQTDSRSYTGRVSTQYAYSSRLDLGLSASGRRRENRAVGLTQPSTRTDVWDVLGSFSYQITPTLSASVQAGPSLIRQQQMPGGAVDPSTCPPVPNPDPATCDRWAKLEKSTTNFFAAASIEKKRETGDVSFSYLRSEARSGTTASSSSINDDVQIAWNERLSDHLTFRAIGVWDRYKQISTNSNSNGRFEINVLRATESLEYALTRRLLLVGQYTYVWQDQSNVTIGSLGATSTGRTVDVHLGYIGIRYTFEPLSY